MATPYNHKAIEKKWRENWEKNPVNVKSDENGKREKYYCLDMFPYPSGNGLHVGHWRGYVISECVEPLQIIAEILYRTSDGMGCIRTSGRELRN